MTARPPIHPALRWTLLVILPALGVLVCVPAAFALIDPSSGAGYVAVLLAGAAGASGLLMVGLVVAPIVPGEGEAAEGERDWHAAAPHPRRWPRILTGWLAGLAVGVALGAGLSEGSDRWGYGGRERWQAFTGPALVILAATVGVALLLLLQRRSGPEPAPLPLVPLHRIALRSGLRGLVAGALAAAFLAPAWWLAADRSFRGKDVAVGALLVWVAIGAWAALLTAAEHTLGRVGRAGRWIVLGGIGAVAPLLAVCGGVWAFELVVEGRTPFDAGEQLIELLWEAASRNPLQTLGWGPVSAVPFTLLGAARAGLLPYFGRRAPWPLPAQLLLGLLAMAATLALLHLLVLPLPDGDTAVAVCAPLAMVVGLVLGLHVARPLEERIARRWVLVTGGRD